MERETDVVISINVFQDSGFLFSQLQNISENVRSNYCVILNCNEFMFHELGSFVLPENVYVNPETITKSRFHGSITHGMVSNMYFAKTKQIKYKYFLVLSARTIFYRHLQWENIKQYFLQSQTIKREMNHMVNTHPLMMENMGLAPDDQNRNNSEIWAWPCFKQTKLAQYYIKRGLPLESSYHEGLCFHYNTVNKILQFFDLNEEIKHDLFDFHFCVEEFSLQTIARNETEEEEEKGSIFIGQGNKDINMYDYSKENVYVCKIIQM